MTKIMDLKLQVDPFVVIQIVNASVHGFHIMGLPIPPEVGKVQEEMKSQARKAASSGDK